MPSGCSKLLQIRLQQTSIWPACESADFGPPGGGPPNVEHTRMCRSYNRAVGGEFSLPSTFRRLDMPVEGAELGKFDFSQCHLISWKLFKPQPIQRQGTNQFVKCKLCRPYSAWSIKSFTRHSTSRHSTRRTLKGSMKTKRFLVNPNREVHNMKFKW